MDKKIIGYKKLVDIIGKTFIRQHKNDLCFSFSNEDKGLFCFLGVDLHPDRPNVGLTANLNEWDIYATCYVLNDNTIEICDCKLP